MLYFEALGPDGFHPYCGNNVLMFHWETTRPLIPPACKVWEGPLPPLLLLPRQARWLLQGRTVDPKPSG